MICTSVVKAKFMIMASAFAVLSGICAAQTTTDANLQAQVKTQPSPTFDELLILAAQRIIAGVETDELTQVTESAEGEAVWGGRNFAWARQHFDAARKILDDKKIAGTPAEVNARRARLLSLDGWFRYLPAAYNGGSADGKRMLLESLKLNASDPAINWKLAYIASNEFYSNGGTEQNKLRTAIEYASKSIRLNPNFPAGYSMLQSLSAARGDDKTMVTNFAQYLKTYRYVEPETSLYNEAAAMQRLKAAYDFLKHQDPREFKKLAVEYTPEKLIKFYRQKVQSVKAKVILEPPFIGAEPRKAGVVPPQKKSVRELDEILGIAPNTRFTPGNTAESLATCINKASKWSTLVVLNEQGKYKEVLGQALSPNLSWNEMKQVLRKTGVIALIFEKQKVVCLVQGRSLEKSKGNNAGGCLSADFKQLLAAYLKLTPKDAENMMSAQGLILEDNLVDQHSKELRGIIEQLVGNKPVKSANELSGRYTINLTGSLSVAFPNASESRVAGWWEWVDAGNTGISFPNALLMNTDESIPWLSNTLELGQGVLTRQHASRELGRLSNCQVEFARGVEWPVVAFAGEKLNADQIISALRVSFTSEVRILPQEKLLYFALPTKALNYMGELSMDKEEYVKALTLTSGKDAGHDNYFGAVYHHTVLLPVDALSQEWVENLLSGEAPDKAIVQLGYTEVDATKIPEMAAKWREQYKDEYMLCVPGLMILIDYQVKNKGTDAAWTSVLGGARQYPFTCVSP